MPRILIAGCGYVGSATADLFHANGWSVEGWTSSQNSVALLGKKPFPVRAVDITDERAVASCGSGFDVVLQCVSSGGGDAEAYRRIYLQGARHLIDVFPSALLLFTSSTSVYAQRDGKWVTETSPAEPKREAGQVLRETEELALRSGGIVARLGGIYGPGRSAILRKMLGGTAAINGDGLRYLNQVHRDDIAAALFLLVRERAAGVFNVADNHPQTERACYEWLASHLNRPVPAVNLSPGERKRGDSNKRVSAEKLRARGWSPRFPDFQTGMTESVVPSVEQLGA